eukprot:SAG22_NODE_19870_length_271_cov_0.581395_1_plen_57_part_01
MDGRMTDEQRYLLDLNGYLLIKNALSAGEVADARSALQPIIESPPASLPPEFRTKGR